MHLFYSKNGSTSEAQSRPVETSQQISQNRSTQIQGRNTQVEQGKGGRKGHKSKEQGPNVQRSAQESTQSAEEK